MISNTTFPFYTSTAQQDANRLNTPAVRICPRDRLLPFQIQRNHLAGVGVDDVYLVDCDGNKTSLGTGYFSSIGTAITNDSSLGTKEFTSVDYIQYAGGPLETLLPYGVYYLEVEDNNGVYYSEHFSVRNLTDELIDSSTNWVNQEYETFTVSSGAITSAIETGTGGYARTGSTFAFTIGQKITFECELTLNSGQLPSVKLGNASNTVVLSDVQQLSAGFNSIELTPIKTIASSYMLLESTAASNFAMPWYRIVNSFGEYIKIEFSNTDDLRHSNEDDIMYSTGGWKQRVYFDTQLNLPAHEPIEIGEELNGKFIAEQLNSTYLYSVVSYVSRSMYNGMQYLFMHDSITITDEVGNEYSPDVGNGQIAPMDWNTFDTGTLRVDFNDGSMTWVNDQANIT